MWNASRMGRRRLEPAPLRRRLAAGVIDALVFLPAFGVAWWQGARLLVRIGHRPRLAKFRDWGKSNAGAARPSLAWRLGNRAASLFTEVGFRNVPSPGYRMMRIQRVTAGSGGPISPERAIVRLCLGELMGRASTQLWRPMQQREVQRMETLRPRLKAIQEEHAGDEVATRQAVADFYREHGVNPFRGCLRPLLLSLTTEWLPPMLSPTRQRIQDRVAGVMVIRR
jgi:60Kd inner membrane protein/RDD family